MCEWVNIRENGLPGYSGYYLVSNGLMWSKSYFDI
jgi:hypothetical protein